jgi:hypothetical protein
MYTSNLLCGKVLSNMKRQPYDGLLRIQIFSPRGRKPLHSKQTPASRYVPTTWLRINGLIIYLQCVESSLILHQNPSTAGCRAALFFHADLASVLPTVAKWRFRKIHSQPGGDSERGENKVFFPRRSDTKRWSENQFI